MEVALAVFCILHTFKSVLVAQSKTCVVLFLRQLVLGITRHDTLQVAVEHAAIGVEHVFTIHSVVESAVALVAPANELGACLQGLSLSKVQCQVGLARVAGAPRTRVGVEVAQCQPYHICHIIVCGTRAIVCRIIVEEIAERQRRGVVGIEPSLVVGAGVDT